MVKLITNKGMSIKILVKNDTSDVNLHDGIISETAFRISPIDFSFTSCFVSSSSTIFYGSIFPSYVVLTYSQGLRLSFSPKIILWKRSVGANLLKGKRYPETPITASITSGI